MRPAHPLHRPFVTAFSGALALLTLTALPAGAQTAPSPDAPACATTDLTRLLREAASSKAAQKRLSDEFEPLFAQAATFTRQRDEAERRWRDARTADKPEAEVTALRTAFDQATSDARIAAGAVQQSLEQRKREELGALLKRIETEYQRLGREQGFRLLMQKGEKEPAYVLVAGSKPSDCRGETDLTAQVMAAIDAPAAKP